MVKFLEKGEKSLLFYTFCQLPVGVVKVIFFKLNTILIKNILTVQKWPKNVLLTSLEANV